MTISNMYGMPIVFDKDLESKIDTSFFGIKEMGKMNVVDLKMWILREFEPLEKREWFKTYFGHCETKNSDTMKKYNEIMDNIDAKFDVRLDTSFHLDRFGGFNSRTSFESVFYKLDIWFDDVLMVECNVDEGWCDEEIFYYDIVSRDFDITKEQCYEDSGLLYDVKTYPYKKKNIENIFEELVMKALSPKRLQRHLELGGDIDDF